jgi:hypothetical protein
MAGVLRDLLASITSRNSDYRGYWLLGFMVEDLLEGFQIDLLRAVPQNPAEPIEVLCALARGRFQGITASYGIPIERLSSAILQGKVIASAVQGAPMAGARRGWMAHFSANAVVDGNRRHYEAFIDVFLSPHDPAKEFESTRTPRT